MGTSELAKMHQNTRKYNVVAYTYTKILMYVYASQPWHQKCLCVEHKACVWSKMRDCAHSARALSSLKVPFTFFFLSHLLLCFQQSAVHESCDFLIPRRNVWSWTLQRCLHECVYCKFETNAIRDVLNCTLVSFTDYSHVINCAYSRTCASRFHGIVLVSVLSFQHQCQEQKCQSPCFRTSMHTMHTHCWDSSAQ